MQSQTEIPASLSRNPATASDMALSFSSTQLPQKYTTLNGKFILHCVSKQRYHPTTVDNFNGNCPIPIIFGTNISE